MEKVKGREVISGQIVHVYYNLHKGGFSIKDKKTGLVCAYASNVRLTSCKFKVSQSGRKKTIAEKRKRVHAFVEGVFEWADQPFEPQYSELIYYNPYTTEHFTVVDTGEHILQHKEVFFKDKVCYAL